MNASNWIAIAGIGSGTIVGGVGALSGWLTQSSQLGARRQAHDERMFEARARVYEAVLLAATRQILAVERTRPILTFGDPPEPPPEPTDDERMRLHARVAAFGSGEVTEALDAFLEAARQFFINVHVLDLMETQPAEAQQLIDAMGRMTEGRETARAAHGT